jgi:hypothetical protein
MPEQTAAPKADVPKSLHESGLRVCDVEKINGKQIFVRVKTGDENVRGIGYIFRIGASQYGGLKRERDRLYIPNRSGEFNIFVV